MKQPGGEWYFWLPLWIACLVAICILTNPHGLADWLSEVMQ